MSTQLDPSFLKKCREVAGKMSQTGFHYHGDFRKVTKVLESLLPLELMAVEKFIDEVIREAKKR